MGKRRRDEAALTACLRPGYRCANHLLVVVLFTFRTPFRCALEYRHRWTPTAHLRIIVPRCSPDVDRQGPAYRTIAPFDWMDGLRRNDPAVVRRLYKEHFPVIRRHVLQNNGTADDAQDIFQEAMAVLWLKAKENALQAASDPGAFLFRVARNKWLDQLRSATHRRMRVVPVEHMPETVADEGNAVEDRLARLREVYARMDDKCRDVLGRFYFERQDLATVAAAMGVEEDSIRTIKYRCMMKLRAFRAHIDGGDDTDRP